MSATWGLPPRECMNAERDPFLGEHRPKEKK